MRSGHAQAQALFLEVGRRMAYKVRKSWTQEFPTDGVWLPGPLHHDFGHLPLVAIEIIVSESSKTMRGSIATLEVVSPSLGVLLLQDEEIRRMLICTGASPSAAQDQIRHINRQLEDIAARSRQRLEVWNFARLRNWYEVLTSRLDVDGIGR